MHGFSTISCLMSFQKKQASYDVAPPPPQTATIIFHHNSNEFAIIIIIKRNIFSTKMPPKKVFILHFENKF